MRVGILGGSSLLGERALPLLAQAGHQVTAFTRSSPSTVYSGITWQDSRDWQRVTLDAFLSFAPIWVLPDYFERLARANVKRVVALSSTSRFIKIGSSDIRERDLAQRLTNTEQLVEKWASAHDIEWIILRPTMIYGWGRDKNIAEIARFIRRFGFYPSIGGSVGLRQPVHVDDIVQASTTALNKFGVESGGYDLSGGETLPYHAMVKRIFQAQKRPERIIPLPSTMLRMGISVMRCLPRYWHLSSALVTRMNQDLVFDHSKARNCLDFSPRPFHLGHNDLPD